MNAKELIAEGRLSEARARLVADVKASPADAGKRTLLFQVLSFLGEWEKAERHLDTLASLNPSSTVGVLACRNIVAAEKKRARVFSGKALPDFISTPPGYVEDWLLALEKTRNGQCVEAAVIIEKLGEDRTPVQGRLNGESFVGFSDTDTILGPFLELITHDRYIWVPFDSVAELSISAPKTLLDLLWIEARLLTKEGLNVQGFLPVLYPNSHSHENEQVKLGRITEWVATDEALAKGAGQHVYQAGDNDVPLLEIRDLVFQTNEKDV
jgi:type VI secretion system protein ImpE